MMMKFGDDDALEYAVNFSMRIGKEEFYGTFFSIFSFFSRIFSDNVENQI